MRSIRKIVLTPAKWAAKRLVNGWLLRFPDGEAQSSVACVYCPEMCRFSCPTAVASGNDAVTPSNKMSLLHFSEQGVAVPGGAWPLYDCTGCGRCAEYCVYDMPVAERLFGARGTQKWEKAWAVAQELTDLDDPWGDLAEELGDLPQAHARSARADLSGWIEPKAWEFLMREKRVYGKAPWDLWGQASEQGLVRLRGKKWLLHESVWHSRRLGRFEQVETWISALRAQGVEIRRPFAQGLDCIDSGGEGAYSRLFAQQAAVMARDIWERDRARIDGILCVSRRGAEHFKKSLGAEVPVEFLGDVYGT